MVFLNEGQKMIYGRKRIMDTFYKTHPVGKDVLEDEIGEITFDDDHVLLNVEDNLLSIIEIKEKDKNKQNIILQNLLNEFDINHVRKSKSIVLSGGERRRLEIARCLASNPDFILLDEPLAGIDPIAVNDIKDLISNLKQKNIGLLITDHNVRSTLEMVDRAYIVYDGKVISEGSPEDIKKNNEVRRVYLGNSF